ncbi:MAG: hypothetical protein SO101_11515 [Lachnospiraceae bacterium]|nr:hypothetical protein [Lachnospiraceae bacterium]
MDKKNRFSVLLKHLMSVTELKNYMLAKNLQYDVSYISKWTSGQMLPAEKTKTSTLQKISHCVVTCADENSLKVLLNEYQVTNSHDLENAIFDHLDAEYDYTRGFLSQTSPGISSETAFYPKVTLSEYISKMAHPVLRRVKSLNIISAMDLLAMEHKYRLQIIDIPDANPSDHHSYPDVHFTLLINLDIDQLDKIYDTVFIIYLLSKNTKIDFLLYASSDVCGKMIFAVEHEFVISGMLIGSSQCLSVVTSENQKTVDIFYTYLKGLYKQENLLFRRTNMYNMFQNHEYIRSLLSPNLRWIIGHMTEHFLPDNLFREIADQFIFEKQELYIAKTELYDLHLLIHNLLKESKIQIIVYESALADFYTKGELDFFNQKVILTAKQRRQYLEYLFTLFQNHTNLELKLVYGQLIPNFQYIANQCIFLSDMLSYLRLDNSNRINNNLVIINRKDIQTLFNDFYETFWTEFDDIIISDRTAICNYIRHIM